MKEIIKNNILLFIFFLFLICFSIIVFLKPKTIFNKDGRPLEFGIGYTKKTILPIWLVVIIILFYAISFYYFT